MTQHNNHASGDERMTDEHDAFENLSTGDAVEMLMNVETDLDDAEAFERGASEGVQRGRGVVLYSGCGVSRVCGLEWIASNACTCCLGV